MTFCFEFADDYTMTAHFFCEEKEIDFSVDISGAFDEQLGDYDDDQVVRIIDQAFGEAFGDGVEWKF